MSDFICTFTLSCAILLVLKRSTKVSENLTWQNPVKARIVEAVEEYPWSSWNDYLSDKGRVNTITETSFILEQTGMDDLCKLVGEPVGDDCSPLKKSLRRLTWK